MAMIDKKGLPPYINVVLWLVLTSTRHLLSLDGRIVVLSWIYGRNGQLHGIKVKASDEIIPASVLVFHYAATA